jgi:hypothetical protein
LIKNQNLQFGFNHRELPKGRSISRIGGVRPIAPEIVVRKWQLVNAHGGEKSSMFSKPLDCPRKT